jgi:hypothetical protein
VDIERLGDLLEGHVECVAESDGGGADVIAVPEGDPRADVPRMVRVPPAAALPDGRPEPWLASRLVRELRRVTEPRRHRSPGVAGMVAGGAYAHPDLRVQTIATFGILLFKPGTVVTAEALESLAERAAECGYSVVRGRTVSAGELRATGLARRHYGAHWEIARAGRLQPEERLALLRIYDRPEFGERFGLSVCDVEVLPVLEYVRRSGTAIETINAWSEASADAHGLSSGGLDGPNELGDLTYVNLYVPADGAQPPVFLLNPHMPSVTAWFEHGPTPLVALLLGAADGTDALAWSRMRAEFSGGPDPATSPLGSLRRDMYEGLWALRYVDDIHAGRARNGVHLSNGPVEAVREASIWFAIGPEQTATGRALMRACGGRTDFMRADYLTVAGRTRVLVDITRDLTTEQAAALLRSGARRTIRGQASNDATVRRLDIAHHVARELTENPAVSAVLVGGSVALDRASADSDLDVLVITSQAQRSGTIERVVRSGVMVELEWLSHADALALAAGGEERDVRELRRSARLALALPVFDPGAVSAALAQQARTTGPDLQSAGERLMEAYAALMELTDAPPGEPAARWAALRGLYDVIAFLLLLASPLRFQKPKWVLADLLETGNDDIAAALMRAYGVNHDPAAARHAVAACGRLVERAATHLGLPTAQTVRELGLVAEYPEYSYLCHCVDDARSLLLDERWADAAYAAKFSVHMAAAMGDGVAAADDDVAIELGRLTAAVFARDAADPPPTDDVLAACLEHLERCKERLLASQPG